MKRIVNLGVTLILFVAALYGQVTLPTASEPVKGKSRTEVVDEVWRMATRGEFLTPEGWSKACGFFTNPTPFPGPHTRVRQESLGAETPSERVDLCIFSTTKRLRHSGNPKP